MLTEKQRELAQLTETLCYGHLIELGAASACRPTRPPLYSMCQRSACGWPAVATIEPRKGC